MNTIYNGKLLTRYFNYKSDYVVVFIISQHKHLICRSVALGDPVIVLEHRAFNDEQNYILEDDVYYTWKQHEIPLLDLIETVGLGTTDFFDYIHSKIGIWLLSSLEDNSLLLDWILPGKKGLLSDQERHKQENDDHPSVTDPLTYKHKLLTDNVIPAIITYHIKGDDKFLLFKGNTGLFLKVNITAFEDNTYDISFSFKEGESRYKACQDDKSIVTEELFTSSFEDVNAISMKLLSTVNELFGFEVLHLNKIFAFSEDRETMEQRMNRGNKTNA